MSCFVMCAMKVKTMWQSRNLTYPEGAAPAVPQYNNQVKNDVIISIGSTLVIIGSLVLLAVPFVLCRYFKLLDEAEVITIFFCAYGLLVHLFPFAFFACEPKSFRLALDALK